MRDPECWRLTANLPATLLTPVSGCPRMWIWRALTCLAMGFVPFRVGLRSYVYSAYLAAEVTDMQQLGH